MKTILRSLTLIAAAALVSPAVFAATNPPSVPDGGSSAAMIALAIGGVAMLRKRMR